MTELLYKNVVEWHTELVWDVVIENKMTKAEKNVQLEWQKNVKEQQIRDFELNDFMSYFDRIKKLKSSTVCPQNIGGIFSDGQQFI